MKTQELNEARRLITKVLSNPGIETDQQDELRRAKRELDKIARTGKLDRYRIYRVIEKVAAILLDVIDAEDTTG
jgi:hypothetical protein